MAPPSESFSAKPQDPWWPVRAEHGGSPREPPATGRGGAERVFLHAV